MDKWITDILATYGLAGLVILALFSTCIYLVKWVRELLADNSKLQADRLADKDLGWQALTDSAKATEAMTQVLMDRRDRQNV